MSIRKKLLLSHLAIILIPCVLFTVAALILLYAFTGSELLSMDEYSEQMTKENKLFSQIKLMTASEPEQLLEPSYLEQMDKEAILLHIYLVVRMDDEVIFRSSHLNKEFESILAPFGQFKTYSHDSIKLNNQRFKYEQHDFFFPNKREGSIFFVKEASDLEQFMLKYHPYLWLILLIILIVTNSTISYFTAKNIINPLITLKNATGKIKEGDLDFQIKSERMDEIGELFSSFEEMRSKLKKSIELQNKYEENRKLLLSNISHDLKTPITTIKGYVEGISDGIANSPDKISQYMNTIKKKTDELDALIDELFLYSKLDLKRIPFQLTKINIIDYLHDCCEELSFELMNHKMNIEFVHSAAAPIYVHADREKLMRVFNNIVFNSVKYMNHDKGKISIQLIDRNDVAEIIISDNGPGFPKEAIPYIFEQFYRADQSRSSATGGSGLGLAIAKQIIEGHEGEIWINPDTKQGAEVHFTLKKIMERHT